MLKATWKSLLGRKVRLLMSAFAIVLGVAFVSGSLIFTNMIGQSFDGIMNGTVADVNVMAKVEPGTESMSAAQSGKLTAAQLEAMRKVEGVESVKGVTMVSDAFIVAKNGKVLGGQGAPAIAGNVVDAPAFGHKPGMVIKSGRMPQAGEVVIDPKSLQRSGYQLGDTLTLASSGKVPSLKLKIVGTVLWGTQESTAGATYAMLDAKSTQQQWGGGGDTWQTAWVTVKEGADVTTVRDRIAPTVPQGFEAKTGKDAAKEAETQVGQVIGFITSFLLVFAAISVVVGSFLIVNTFTILVAQRSRELALLRAMGASRGQVRRSVLLEAAITGLVGSTVGLFLGLAVAKGIAVAFAQMGLDMGGIAPALTPAAVAASYAVGLLVTLLAAYVPARKASAVPPVAAMTGDAMTGHQGLGKRLAVGITMAVVGIVVLLVGLFWDGAPTPLAWIGVGALLTLLGVSLASPVLGRPLLWALGKAYRAVFGQIGTLAHQNSVRNPRRTAATASALMIGITLVTTMAIIGQSAKTSLTSIIEGSLRGDFMYSNPSFQPFSPTIAQEVAKVDGVKSIHTIRIAPAKVAGERDALASMEGPGDFDKITKQTLTQGDLSKFTTGTAIAPTKLAKEKGWKIGSTIPVQFPQKSVPLTLVATFDQDKGMDAGLTTTHSTLALSGLPPQDFRIIVDAEPGTDLATLRGSLEKVVADQPMITVRDSKEFADSQTAQIDMLLNLIYALLAFAVLIAVLGIINTLGLSVIERTREIGLLRAIGLGRGQLRRMMRLESVAISLLGSVLGLGMGLLFGFAIVRALQDDGLSLHVPWIQLVLFLVVAAVVGVLAALWPAHRAARMDVLKAISTT